jgi:hypothetical protein
MNPKARLICIALGAIFWLIGVVAMRFAGDTLLAARGVWLVALYASSFVTSYLCIIAGKAALGLEPRQVCRAMCVMSYAALLLDGATMTWFGDVYTPDPALRLRIAAFLLWTFGSGLVLGDVLTPPDRPSEA